MKEGFGFRDNAALAYPDISDAVAVATPQIFSSALKTHPGLQLPWECSGLVLHTLSLGRCLWLWPARLILLVLRLQPIGHLHCFAAAAPLLLCCLCSTGPWVGINKLPL